MPDTQPNDDGSWEQQQFEAQSAHAVQTGAPSSSESSYKNDSRARQQLQMAAQIQAAQIAAYQNQVAQINDAQMQEEEEAAEENAAPKGAAQKPKSWKTQYMALLFTGMLVDGISVLEYFPMGFLVTVPTNFMYSVYRWRTLDRLNAGTETSHQRWMRRFRTIVGGGIGTIAGGSFANTQMMFWEYMAKRSIKPSSIFTAKGSTVIKQFSNRRPIRYKN